MSRAGRRCVAALACVSLMAGRARAQGPGADAPGVEGSADAPAMTGDQEVSDQAVALGNFREGARLYKERRYREAAAAFERSLQAVWSINAAYNMALSLDRVGDEVAAFEAYRRYLERAESTDEHRATAQERAEALRGRLGEVQLQLDSPEAIREIRINGEVVAREAFPWWTKPGPLAVEFIGEAEGQVQEVRAEVRPSGTATIVFPGFPRPAEEVRPQPPPEAPPPSPARPRALRAGFWSLLGLTAASGVSIGVFGALTLEYEWRRSNLKESCGVPCDPSLPSAWERKFEAFHAATNAMIGVTVALGVAAAVVGIVALRERPRRTSTVRARVRWFGPAAELTF